ncbi:hypothetical protein [Inquilinus sp. CAU 1745]|uniref:hypothetical protein n=1 Tax=Inquilinus sp. CAU 1745 TaxID=3140369 RepID=UPI00325B625D
MSSELCPAAGEGRIIDGMHCFHRLLPVALILALALGLTAQAARVDAMAMGMMSASDMDGARLDNGQVCSDMDKGTMAASGCQGAACTNAMPMALAAAPTILPMPAADFAVWMPGISAGLSASPDPYPPRHALFV